MNNGAAQSRLESARLRVVLATIVLNVIAVFWFAAVPWSNWRTGLALNIVDNTLLIIHVIRRRDSFMAHLMVFGLVVGFVELAADAWLVEGTRTLDYTMGGGPDALAVPDLDAIGLGDRGCAIWVYRVAPG